MKSTPLSLALRLATILEEFSDKEIRAAIAILESHGGRAYLLDYLMVSGEETGSATDANTPISKKRAEVQRSKAVSKLESSDPEKFSVLSEFEAMIRGRKVFYDPRHREFHILPVFPTDEIRPQGFAERRLIAKVFARRGFREDDGIGR